jgi:predicted HicB family RNase H-like nuclease
MSQPPELAPGKRPHRNTTSTVFVGFRLPREMHKPLKELAAAEQRSLSNWILLRLREWMAGRVRKNA